MSTTANASATQTDLPTFSVIIPVFNREKFVGAAIESALAQEMRPQQIIVVDDGSTDQSLKIIEGYGDAVVLYRQANSGCAAARNLAAEHSVGEYLAFLDSDDVWYPWTLRLVAEAIQQYGRPPLLATARIPFSTEAPPRIDQPKSRHTRVFPDLYAARRVVGTCVMVVRNDVFREAGQFAPINMNGTDAEFNLRLGIRGPFVQFDAPAMLGYRQHGTNVMNNLDGTFRGQSYMIEQENAGNYPGGTTRKFDRIDFITSQTRSLSLAALKLGRNDIAWTLYRKTLRWHIMLRRWRYLLGLPFLTLVSWFRRPVTR